MRDEVFVGRRDEIGRFEAILRELPSEGRIRALLPPWHRPRSKNYPAHNATSQVVLVYGLGGSGKSRLLQQFQRLAVGDPSKPSVTPGFPTMRGSIRAVWLDWAVEQEERPDQYRDMGGPTLITVLDALIMRVVKDPAVSKKARERAERGFINYRNGVSKLEEYRQRFAEVITKSEHSGSPFTKEDAATLLKSMGSIGFVMAGHPAGALGLTSATSASAVQAAAHLSEAAARAVTGKKPGDVSQDDYDLVIDASRELIRRVADGLRAVARAQSLVILLDTGEVLSATAWNWLRQIMVLTGPSIVWVVGARFEAESEAGPDSPIYQFSRKIGDAHLRRMPLTRFDDATIGDYLSGKTGAAYSSAQIDMVAKLTRGLPLAVSLVADLIEEGQSVYDIYRQTGDNIPGSIVSELARRYLVYAEKREYQPDDPRSKDLQRILVLALGFNDPGNDYEYLSELWETSEPLDAFLELAQRHDFVLPASRRLHEDVQVAIRGDLLDRLRRERIRQVNQRALDMFKKRLADMRLRLRTLDDQVANEKFKTTLLCALWHAFWMDNQSGLDLLIETLPLLAVASPGTGNTAAAIAHRFVGTFDADQQITISLITAAPEVADASPLSTQRILSLPDTNWIVRSERSKYHWSDITALHKEFNASKWKTSLLGITAGGPAATLISNLVPWFMPALFSNPNARTVRYTEGGLKLRPPQLGTTGPLIGELSDRDAAVSILAAVLALQGDEEDKTQIAEGLKRASELTKNTVLQSQIDLLLSIISPHPTDTPTEIPPHGD